MSADQCPKCGLRPSSLDAYNHTAWCPNATTHDWPEHMLKDGKKQRGRKKNNQSKDAKP